MLKRGELITLILIAVLGLFLRLLFVKDGAITFGFDQARDAFMALSIAQGHLRILGPSASAPGLFHGVLYFYLLSPAYWLGQGNPLIANIWLSLINIVTIVPIFLLGRMLFNSKVGFLAAFLFAISLDAVQYANWMSNPAPAVLSGAIFYLGLAMYIFRKNLTWGVILTALGLGLCVQFEVFLGYLLVPLVLAMSVFKVQPKARELMLFGGVFLLSVSTMVVSYIKFGPTFLNGFTVLYGKGGDPFAAWREFSPTVNLYLNRFAEYFYRGLLPFNVNFAGAVGLLIVGFAIARMKSKAEDSKPLMFLLIMLFSHGILVAFGGESTPFINAGLEAVILILVAYFLVTLFLRQKITAVLFLVLIIFSSLYAIFKYNPQGQTVFAIQRGLILHNEEAAVDYTYRSSGNKPFSVNTVTSPLWINTVWAYLYNWYGQKNYGYLPSFHGRDQTGYLGSLPDVAGDEQSFFLILEPPAGIPAGFIEGTIGYEDSFSKIVEEKDFGGIRVQKRALTKNLGSINFIK